jgi:hypothetical protein
MDSGVMARKTFHVYRADGTWAVKREGASAETFGTQREAVKAARESAKNASGQIVIHGRDGRIREHETYGMAAVLEPPKKSRLAKRIGQAVGKVALERVQSDPTPPRADSH